MAKRGIRKQDHEKLDDLTLGRVVSLLEQDSPITKKVACDILNISYNTTRLAGIIQEYKDKLEYAERRKKQLKGTDIIGLELKDLVVSYLTGESIASISRRLFRSTHTIKTKIKDIHLPEKITKPNYKYPELLPEEMVAEEFALKEYVWSAKYNCVAQIMDVFSPGVYCIYIFGKYMEFGYQPVHELGKLDILKQFSLQADEFQTSAQDFNLRIL